MLCLDVNKDNLDENYGEYKNEEKFGNTLSFLSNVVDVKMMPFMSYIINIIRI